MSQMTQTTKSNDIALLLNFPETGEILAGNKVLETDTRYKNSIFKYRVTFDKDVRRSDIPNILREFFNTVMITIDGVDHVVENHDYQTTTTRTTMVVKGTMQITPLSLTNPVKKKLTALEDFDNEYEKMVMTSPETYFRAFSYRGFDGPSFRSKLFSFVSTMGENYGYCNDKTIYHRRASLVMPKIKITKAPEDAKMFYHTHPKRDEPSLSSADDYLLYFDMSHKPRNIRHFYTVMADRMDYFHIVPKPSKKKDYVKINEDKFIEELDTQIDQAGKRLDEVMSNETYQDDLVYCEKVTREVVKWLNKKYGKYFTITYKCHYKVKKNPEEPTGDDLHLGDEFIGKALKDLKTGDASWPDFGPKDRPQEKYAYWHSKYFTMNKDVKGVGYMGLLPGDDRRLTHFLYSSYRGSEYTYDDLLSILCISNDIKIRDNKIRDGKETTSRIEDILDYLEINNEEIREDIMLYDAVVAVDAYGSLSEVIGEEHNFILPIADFSIKSVEAMDEVRSGKKDLEQAKYDIMFILKEKMAKVVADALGKRNKQLEDTRTPVSINAYHPWNDPADSRNTYPGDTPTISKAGINPPVQRSKREYKMVLPSKIFDNPELLSEILEPFKKNEQLRNKNNTYAVIMPVDNSATTFVIQSTGTVQVISPSKGYPRADDPDEATLQAVRKLVDKLKEFGFEIDTSDIAFGTIEPMRNPRSGVIVAVTGPIRSTKNKFIDSLSKRMDAHVVTTFTTKTLKDYEKKPNIVEVTDEIFDRMEINGELVVVTKSYDGHRRGFSKKDMKEKDFMLVDARIKDLHFLINASPSVISFYLHPTNTEAMIESYLLDRVSPQEAKRVAGMIDDTLDAAEGEVEHIIEYDIERPAAAIEEVYNTIPKPNPMPKSIGSVMASSNGEYYLRVKSNPSTADILNNPPVKLVSRVGTDDNVSRFFNKDTGKELTGKVFESGTIDTKDGVSLEIGEETSPIELVGIKRQYNVAKLNDRAVIQVDNHTAQVFEKIDFKLPVHLEYDPMSLGEPSAFISTRGVLIFDKGEDNYTLVKRSEITDFKGVSKTDSTMLVPLYKYAKVVKSTPGKHGGPVENPSKKISIRIDESTNPEKKMMAVFTKPNGRTKTIHFGARGMSDYTQHKDKDRMKNYLARHGGMGEDWNDPMTAGALSRWILWGKPSLRESFNDFKKRFNMEGVMAVTNTKMNPSYTTKFDFVPGKEYTFDELPGHETGRMVTALEEEYGPLGTSLREDALHHFRSKGMEGGYGFPGTAQEAIYKAVIIPNEELVERFGHLQGKPKLQKHIEKYGLDYPSIGNEGNNRRIAMAKLGRDMPHLEVVPAKMNPPSFIAARDPKKWAKRYDRIIKMSGKELMEEANEQAAEKGLKIEFEISEPDIKTILKGKTLSLPTKYEKLYEKYLRSRKKATISLIRGKTVVDKLEFRLIEESPKELLTYLESRKRWTDKKYQKLPKVMTIGMSQGRRRIRMQEHFMVAGLQRKEKFPIATGGSGGYEMTEGQMGKGYYGIIKTYQSGFLEDNGIEAFGAGQSPMRSDLYQSYGWLTSYSYKENYPYPSAAAEYYLNLNKKDKLPDKAADYWNIYRPVYSGTKSNPAFIVGQGGNTFDVRVVAPTRDPIMIESLRAATDPSFKHHKWYVKHHLDYVRIIAHSLVGDDEPYPPQMIDDLVWMHDYPKMMGDKDNFELVRELVSKHRSPHDTKYLMKILQYMEELKSPDWNRRTTALTEIMSTADALAHYYGPFFQIYIDENPDMSMEEIKKSNRQKLAKDKLKLRAGRMQKGLDSIKFQYKGRKVRILGNEQIKELIEKKNPMAPSEFPRDTKRVIGVPWNVKVPSAVKESVSSLPIVEEGKIRLYRGERGPIPESLKGLKDKQGREIHYYFSEGSYGGSFYTDNLAYAWANAMSPIYSSSDKTYHDLKTDLKTTPAKLVYIDLPKSEAKKYWSGRKRLSIPGQLAQMALGIEPDYPRHVVIPTKEFREQEWVLPKEVAESSKTAIDFVWKNPMAPGYQSYSWTTEDWRSIKVNNKGEIDYKEKCGAEGTQTPDGSPRLCLPVEVIRSLLRTESGKDVIRTQARKKARAKKGERVPWHPRIKKIWKRVKEQSPKDKKNPPKILTPVYIRKHPNTLFVFGDNDMRTGKGGQAVNRDEPNAIGIRTKHKPTTNADAYYTDDNYTENIRKMQEDLDNIKRLSADYESVYFMQGIGEGRAKLEEKAPKTYAWLKNNLSKNNFSKKNPPSKVIIVSGPSGSGKSTISKTIAKELGGTLVPTVTTRSRRPKEKEGEDRIFVSKDEFKEMIDNNEFVEYKQHKDGVFYGRRKTDMDDISIVEVSLKGMKEYKELYPDSFAVFLEPDKSPKEIEKRLLSRGGMSEANAKARASIIPKQVAAAKTMPYDLFTKSRTGKYSEVAKEIISQIPMANPGWRHGESATHGIGMFATEPIKKGTIVLKDGGEFRRLNHSDTPNIKFEFPQELIGIAMTDISEGEELLGDYRQLAKLTNHPITRDGADINAVDAPTLYNPHWRHGEAMDEEDDPFADQFEA